MIQEYLSRSLEAKKALIDDQAVIVTIEEVVKLLAQSFSGGHKLLIAGNGGSAADSQHFSTEIVATLKKENRRGYPAIALTTDTSFLTAWINDFGVEQVFARQVEALGVSGDVFFGISTSGNSENIIQAVMKAQSLGLKTVGLLGGDGGKLRTVVDHAIIVPSKITAHIQECHIAIIHAICEELIVGFS